MNINFGRVALNPLQYFATDDGWLDPTQAPPLAERLAYISSQGFKSVQTDVPQELTPGEYVDALTQAGLAPGPGYISVHYSDDPEARNASIERAQRIAVENRAAGSDLIFLALGMDPDAPRIKESAAIGYEANEDRLQGVIDLVAEAAEKISAIGVVPALHPHVGTWVETEAETRAVLESVPAEILKFGPDTGHLTWAGADTVKLLTEYSDRIEGIHIKDIFVDAADRARAERLGYRETVSKGLWTEPGTGDADFDALFGALPSNFQGWTVIEVDKANRLSAAESIALCADWLRKQS